MQKMEKRGKKKIVFHPPKKKKERPTGERGKI